MAVTLDELDLDRDVADLHVAMADAEVSQPWLGWTPSRDVAETRARLAERAAAPGARIWVIREETNGPALGVIEDLGGVEPPGRHGLTWMIRPSHQRRGLTGQAASMVVTKLLQSGATSVEAWADVDNIASIHVAQKAGLAIQTRFALREGDKVVQKVVLGRLRDEPDMPLYDASPVLRVRDVAATAALLVATLGFDLGFHTGTPMRYARMRVAPWPFAPGIRLLATDTTPNPANVDIETGAHIDALCQRAIAAGATCEAPGDLPWGRVEFVMTLAEGHRLIVSGPAR